MPTTETAPVEAPPQTQAEKDDVDIAREAVISKYYGPHNLQLPQHVEAAYAKAKAASGLERAKLIRRAFEKAEMHYLHAWANREIKVTTPRNKMTEETKAKLREINKHRKEERDIAKLYSPNKVKNVKPASNQKLKGAVNTMSDTIETTPAATTTPAKAKKVRTPTYQDVGEQAAICGKYAWVVAGSFKADPVKVGGTVLDIKCIKCGGLRTIHLADAFQVKLCAKCKAESQKKVKKVEVPAVVEPAKV